MNEPVSLYQATRINHFVPRSYLRNWSEDGKRIWSHALLVPHENYPMWDEVSIRRAAAHEHLYTSVLGNGLPDAFERWLNEEIEIPADEALKKVATDRPLDRKELDALVRFAAALDRRTPASYLEHMARWEKSLPSLIESTLARAVGKLEEAARTGQAIRAARAPVLARPLPFRLTIGESDSGSDLVPVHGEIVAGRELWLYEMEYALKHTGKALLRHTWSVARPHPKTAWFTSDHPVLRLNFYAGGRYDFGGGWGCAGSEFILPLSPQHLLYTKVGERFPPEFIMPAKETITIQRFLAERAFRTIFAASPMPRVRWFRERTVDSEAYKVEQAQWRAWHAQQSEAVLWE